jgi:molybdate transport system substrate-binding protein
VYIKLAGIALNHLTIVALVASAAASAPRAAASAPRAAFAQASAPRGQPEIHVAAAVSLSEALQEIATAFERQHGVRVALNLAASNVLARQIAAGARTDVFISADAIQMDAVRRTGMVRREVDLLTNRLVVLVVAGSTVSLTSASDLRRPEIARIAIGDPAGVPAGAYAKQYLQAEKVWDALQPKIITTGSVRAALAALEAGNVDAAIVYRTDARIARRARAAYPSPSEPVVTYPAALLTVVPEADRFYAFLRSPEADAVFERHGFSLPGTREERAPRVKGGS